MKVFEFAAMVRTSGAATARVFRRRLSRSAGSSDRVEEEAFSDPASWQTVTISASQDELAPDGELPEPLAKLADLIEVRLRPAPGDRGTELSARSKGAARPETTGWKGEDPARRIRTALQQARQLVEVGEVLLVEPQPAGKRRGPTAGLLLDLMSDDADQEGVV